MTRKDKVKYIGIMAFLAVCFFFILFIGVNSLIRMPHPLIFAAMVILILGAEGVIGLLFYLMFREYKIRKKEDD